MLAVAAVASKDPLSVTVRRQHMSTVGRQEWVVNNTVASWAASETAVVVVDMW